jgi:sugar lactone lactonase YvrE
MRLQPSFRPLGNLGAVLGESPFWDGGDSVWWVDVPGRQLLRTRLSTGLSESWPTPEIPGFVVLAAPERPYVGMESGIHAFLPARGQFSLVVPNSGQGQRFNDATVDGTGRLWTSLMDLDLAEGRGSIVVVTPDLRLREVEGGLSIPNGLAADHASARLYFSDSHAASQQIWYLPCDFASGETGARVPFADLEPLPGRPDGAAVIPAGRRYWIAAIDGGVLYGFDPDGKLAATVVLPFPAPTKPAFFAGRLVVTAKAAGDHDGRPVIAAGLPAELHGPALPFWRHAPLVD